MFMTPFTTDKLLKCERAIKVSQALSTADLRCRLSSCSAMLRGDKREPLVLGHKDLTDKTSAKVKLFAQELSKFLSIHPICILTSNELSWRFLTYRVCLFAGGIFSQQSNVFSQIFFWQ